MVNQLLVTLVNSVLKTGKATARNNYAYDCPFCHKPKKLEVKLTENREGKNPWHCWSCDVRGTTIYNLFKQLKTDISKFTELKSLVKSSTTYKIKHDVDALKLPLEYVGLINPPIKTDIMARHALAFLKKRNITESDIIKYNIGYCSTGRYRNRVIIPTYSKDGSLNYFTGRSFEAESTYKYMNPESSRDVIANEHLINWNVPVILCEGLFDAIAIKRNAIPLLGKNIQSSLMKKIVTSVVDKIYIALDRDAIKQALRFCEKLMAEGKEVYLVDMQDKDPSEMGFENFTKLIQNTVPLTYYDLMEYKLSI